MTKWILLLSSALAVIIPAPSSAAEPPPIPTGYDAYRQWDRWPVQRIGARAYMRSTYDRTGGNRRADASNFLYQTADDFNVTLDVESPGIMYFARYNYWHGSPWHYEVDGVDNIVEETSTKDPNNRVEGSVFLPEKAFPSPLTYTWSTTNGADLSWVPVGFEKSFRMAYARTKYGTGYYIYHQFVPGTPLSQPVRALESQSISADRCSRIAIESRFRSRPQSQYRRRHTAWRTRRVWQHRGYSKANHSIDTFG